MTDPQPAVATDAPSPSALDGRALRAWQITVLSAVALLAVANVMSNRVLPEAWYVPWNMTIAIVLVVVAKRQVEDREIGFTAWRRGLAFGLTLFALTALVMVIAVLMPAFHDLYEDRRVQGGATTMLYQAVVRIPLGTALLEEVAFRGVLPALFAKRIGFLRGSIVASVLFGLWHVLPAWRLNQVNPTASSVFGSGVWGTVAAVTFAVIGTTLAGLWWCFIRHRARSVLATIIGHIATNSIGYVIAYVVVS